LAAAKGIWPIWQARSLGAGTKFMPRFPHAPRFAMNSHLCLRKIFLLCVYAMRSMLAAHWNSRATFATIK